MPTPEERRLIVAVTGASGSIYASTFLRHALVHFDRVYLAYSEQASQVAATELGAPLGESQTELERFVGAPCQKVTVVSRRDFFSPPASGSFRHEGMAIVPCSMGTAGRIANGTSDDLVTRAADVCLKERRKLVLVPRETPLNLVHLRNLTALAEAGAVILPASPGFYHCPKGLQDLADFIAARILQQFGIDHRLVPEWQSQEE